MKSKFDLLFRESYKKLFEEEFPSANVNDDESDAPEDVIMTKDVPNIDSGSDSDDVDIPSGDESKLPDPKEQETVKIDLLNTFIDFLNMPEDERENILKEYGLLNSRADSSNYEEKLEALKSISKSVFPDRSI